MKRARALVVVGLAMMAAGLGTVLGLSSSGPPNMGMLTGAILAEYGGPIYSQALPDPGTVIVQKHGRLVATEPVAKGQRSRLRLPTSIYEVGAKSYEGRAETLPLHCNPVDASVRSDKVVSAQVACIGVIG